MVLAINKTLKKIAAEEARLQTKKNAARADAVETVNSIISVFGLKASELDFSGKTAVKAAPKAPRAPRARKVIPPKYRGPKGELWTGRGKQPRWVAEALAQGLTLEGMRIDAAPAAEPAAAPAA